MSSGEEGKGLGQVWMYKKVEVGADARFDMDITWGQSRAVAKTEAAAVRVTLFGPPQPALKVGDPVWFLGVTRATVLGREKGLYSIERADGSRTYAARTELQLMHELELLAEVASEQ